MPSKLSTRPMTAARRSCTPSMYLSRSWCCSAESATALSRLASRSAVATCVCSSLLCASLALLTASCRPLLSALKSSKLMDCLPRAAMLPSMLLACLSRATCSAARLAECPSKAASKPSARLATELLRSCSASKCLSCLLSLSAELWTDFSSDATRSTMLWCVRSSCVNPSRVSFTISSRLVFSDSIATISCLTSSKSRMKAAICSRKSLICD
mmetsp:Transcript_70498/g.194860  ORF Transcript_70498/g.194860 Transcript_70498/m.194860 type:complete len:213 (+) Transcript_70498:578-1216(+)